MLIEQPRYILEQQARLFWNDPQVVEMHEHNALYRSLYEEPLRQIVHTQLHQCSFPARGPLLEVGCGAGELSHLAQGGFRQRLVSVDVSGPSLVVNRAEHPDAKLVRTDANTMGFRRDAFVGVVGFSSFDSLPFLAQVLHEVARVTKPDSPILLIQDVVVPLYSPYGPYLLGNESVEQYHRALVNAFRVALFPIEYEGNVEAVSVIPRSTLQPRVQQDSEALDMASQAILIGSDRGEVVEVYIPDQLEQFRLAYGVQADIPVVPDDMVVQWVRVKVLRARLIRHANSIPNILKSFYESIR
jgi:ubiquinone/menaquinone biosynthesis C-methylase UbiE